MIRPSVGAVRLELDLLRGEAVSVLLGWTAARNASPEESGLPGLGQAGGPLGVAGGGPERPVAHDAGHDLLCDPGAGGIVEDLGLGRHPAAGRLRPLKDRMAVAERRGRSAVGNLEGEISEGEIEVDINSGADSILRLP